MFFERLSRAWRTLRFRLMLWSAVVVVLTAAVTLIGMQVGVRRALLHEIDQFLLDDVREIGRSLAGTRLHSAGKVQNLGPPQRAHRGHGRFVTILNDSGAVVWASDDQPMSLPASLPSVDFDPMNAGRYRLVQQSFNDVDRRRLRVRVGIPLSVIDEDIARVDWLAGMVACVALMIAPLLGYWLSGRVVNVLSDLTGRTSRLRPTQLDERLPVRGTGDELDQLALTVNGLLDRLASHLNRREDFVANAAHELRTPVAAIRTTAEVALGSARTKEEYEGFLADVIEECMSLELLVNQLLLLSESDADQLRIHGERVALDEIVQQAAEMFGAVAESLGLNLHVHTVPTTVEGNRQHLRQVINNLLDNAIKYTPPGGSVRIELAPEAAGNHCLLTVRDTGIGIPVGDLPHVFERFYRCDKSRSHVGEERGAGLGLSICQTVVETHGGQIWVESQPGKGTLFAIRLPTAARSQTSTDWLGPTGELYQDD